MRVAEFLNQPQNKMLVDKPYKHKGRDFVVFVGNCIDVLTLVFKFKTIKAQQHVVQIAKLNRSKQIDNHLNPEVKYPRNEGNDPFSP